MARYTKSISIAFNDNDGGLTYSVNPETADDIQRYYKLHGKWKARLMFIKAFWDGLICLERIHHILINKEDERKIP